MSWKHDRRKEARIPHETELDVNIDTDNLEATSVDISESGIRFHTQTPLQIDVRFNFGEEEKTQTGRLVWAKKNPNGDFTYAFEYIRPENT